MTQPLSTGVVKPEIALTPTPYSARQQLLIDQRSLAYDPDRDAFRFGIFSGMPVDGSLPAKSVLFVSNTLSVGGPQQYTLSQDPNFSYNPLGGVLTMPTAFSIGANTSSLNAGNGMALGNGAVTSGGGSNPIAIGTNANASQADSVALGRDAINTYTGEIGLGPNLVNGFMGYLYSSTNAKRLVANIAWIWANSTDATRKGRLLFYVFDATTLREGMRIESDGTQALVGFFGGLAAAKPTVTGSRGGNAALASLLTALANLGLITDSSIA